MQLDDELRRRVDAAAEQLPVATDDAYATVLSRGRRNFVRPLAWGVAAAALALGIFVAPNLFGSDERPEPRRPAVAPPIEGTFATQISAGSRAVRLYDLEGSWELDFDGEGGVTATMPLAFVRKIGTAPGYDVQFEGDTMTTDVFAHAALGCGEPGTYRWSLAGDTLTFEEIEDPCPYRPAILTGASWASEG